MLRWAASPYHAVRFRPPALPGARFHPLLYLRNLRDSTLAPIELVFIGTGEDASGLSGPLFLGSSPICGMHPEGSSGVGHCAAGFGSANRVVERVMLATLASRPARPLHRQGTGSLAAPPASDDCAAGAVGTVAHPARYAGAESPRPVMRRVGEQVALGGHSPLSRRGNAF